MSTLDEIAKEKQRIGEALARADAQHEKLTGQLSELEATERVLARYSKGTQTKKAAADKTPTATTKAAPMQSRRRPTTEKPAGGKRSSSTLSDQVLALATGKTQQEITAACKGARANHVGAAISRHKRAGRIEERDGKLYATQSAGTEQRAAV
jgi:cell wall-associated NlpC family hydrolase